MKIYKISGVFPKLKQVRKISDNNIAHYLKIRLENNIEQKAIRNELKTSNIKK